jgi:methyl-galactoside transport system substrate-binding protein
MSRCAPALRTIAAHEDCPMKRLILVLAALALVVSGCAKSPRVKPRIGVAMRSFDDSVSVSLRRAIETAALDRADLAIIDGQNQQSAQDLQLDSFFERKLGALAVAAVDPAAVGALIAKAKTRQMPVVFFGRKPSDEAMRSWDKLFFVGSRDSDAAAGLGQILAAWWKAEPTADKNKDGSLQFVALEGNPGAPDASLLSENLVKALGAAGIRAERLEPARAGTAATGDEATALISKYGDRIEAAVCADASLAPGAIGAFKSAGYLRGRKAFPVLALGEGEPEAPIAQALAEGSLLGAAYADSASQGQAIFDLDFALARSADPARAGWIITDAKYVWIPYKLYRKNSVTPPAKK